MTSVELRRKFLDFFRSKGHVIVPSDSLVPAKDPTLLFTGAGMNQFKEYFLGGRKDLQCAASCQKCFRTGDVEQVGQTPSHLTFFEMLGNFSFGDYFKREAIPFAWEFLTKDLKISADRLWASVYEKDDEAAEIWKKKIGLPPQRIVRFGAKDNFWPSNAPKEGPNGPCGPSSEIYYDYQRCVVGKPCPDPKNCKPGCPCGRFVEIWNLVFTQYDRQSDGSLKDLPAKNIDTGMGLERLTAVMQDKMSVFETDLFEPIVKEIKRLLFKEAGPAAPKDQLAYIDAIADHVRGLTFLIADGIVPSNDGRGYVLRMLLRKAERAGIGLGLMKPFLYKLVPVVTKIMEEPYPELTHRRESIAKVILTEEEKFWQTLEEKIPLLEEEVRNFSGRTKLAEADAGRTYRFRWVGNVLPGSSFPAENAARFYDTHGLSYDEIVDVCRREGVNSPTHEEFDKALVALQAKSKAASAFAGDIFARDKLHDLLISFKQSTDFVGYTELAAKAKVIGLIQENRLVNEVKAPAVVQVLLDHSPFYGEAGGQVGDAGVIQAAEGRLAVSDTQWVGNLLVHQAQLTEGRVRVNEPVTATVDAARRRHVAQNHTATHLLHSALRKVLGPHVVQAGSLVAPDHLRFDFSHTNALSSTQRDSVESLVNEWVGTNLPVSIAQMSLDEARRTGAMSLFGEKYGSQVRVVSIGEISKELCGGTHLHASGEVSLFKLVEERSVAAGIRRVKALTDRQVVSHQEEEQIQLAQRAEKLAQRAKEKELEEQLEQLKMKEARVQAQKVTPQKLGAVTVVFERLDGQMDHVVLRSFADAIRKTEPDAVIFLTDAQGFCVATSGGVAQQRGISANELLKLSTSVAGGSGGGRAEMAQGKVNEPAKFPEIRQRLEKYILEKVGV